MLPELLAKKENKESRVWKVQKELLALMELKDRWIAVVVVDHDDDDSDSGNISVCAVII